MKANRSVIIRKKVFGRITDEILKHFLLYCSALKKNTFYVNHLEGPFTCQALFTTEK